MAEAVHIGKAATLAGVSADTIRFYQELGLIKSAGRSAGGYRLFEGEQIRDHICATCPGIGVLSDRSQNCWRYDKSTTVVPRYNPYSTQGRGCAAEDQQPLPAGSRACRRVTQVQSRTASPTGNQA